MAKHPKKPCVFAVIGVVNTLVDDHDVDTGAAFEVPRRPRGDKGADENRQHCQTDNLPFAPFQPFPHDAFIGQSACEVNISDSLPPVSEATIIRAMSDRDLGAYADAIVRQCIDMQPGETLLIDCELGHRDLAVAITEAAYRIGVTRVDVHYSDRRLQRARITSGSPDAGGELAPWAQARLRATLSPSAAIVRIVGDDEPGVLADVDSMRLSSDFAARAHSVRWFTKAVIANRVRWAIVAWPTEAWAEDVYPELAGPQAVRRLGADLLAFCRLGPGDAPTAWADHARTLRERAALMTARNFARLHFVGPGTDLHIGLAPDGIWLGGGELVGEGRMTYANFPTEEIFTSPVAGQTEGTFQCTTPLSFNGRVIEGIHGAFARGRLVAIGADRDRDGELLERTFATDRGAGRLGEVALVDAASRIGRAGRVYGETLLDENAASHIAFGNGFGGTRSAGGRINRSVIHVDVMIGSGEVSVHGVDNAGRTSPVIVDGEWRLT